MNGFSVIDWVLVVAYFVVFMWVGKWSTSKVKTTEDYLLAGRQLGKIPAALSTAATDFGGSGLVGCAGLAYTVGIAGGWWDVAATPAWLILGFFIVGRMRRIRISTVPEMLEKRYDLKTRLVASTLFLANAIVTITAQTKVSAIAFTSVTGIPEFYTVIIATILFVVITTTGGLVAVAWTDVLLFCVLMAGVITVVPLSIAKVGGISAMISATPESFWDPWALGYMVPAAWVFMCFYNYGSRQNFLQRVFASKDVPTARFAYTFTGVAYIFYGLFVALLGIAAYIIVPGLENQDMAFAELVKNVLPIGLKGLILASLLAATMSTSDSILNSATSIFSYDIYQRVINPNAGEKEMLLVSRVATVVIAALSMVATYMMGNVVSIIVLASLIYSAGVFFPLILGLYNRRLNAHGAFVAVLIGGVVSLISKFYLYQHVEGFFGALHPMFTGSFASLAALLVISYVTKPPAPEKIHFIDELKMGVDELKGV
jgi:SSS family solute:Na+ symporter